MNGDRSENDNVALRINYMRWLAEGEKIICPGCRESIMRLYRIDHLEMYIIPATKGLIGRAASPTVEDFYAFCVVNNFNLDSLGPKHPTTVEALTGWIRYHKAQISL